jgi:hypothetical protein
MKMGVGRPPGFPPTRGPGQPEPSTELLQAARHGRPIESGPAHPDRVDPPDLVAVQQLADQVLAARGVPAPIVCENEERRAVGSHGVGQGADALGADRPRRFRGSRAMSRDLRTAPQRKGPGTRSQAEGDSRPAANQVPQPESRSSRYRSRGNPGRRVGVVGPTRARDGFNSAIKLWGLVARTEGAQWNRGRRTQGRRRRRVIHDGRR